MLIGRERERAELEALLDAARGGTSGALVVRGEAGVGKSALLAAVAEGARDFLVLRARGFESESDIPFAGLYELLTPLLDRLDALPPVQAAALRAALALGEPVGHDRFAVPAGVLSLLAAAAEERPVLAVVDDLQWLDPASAEALLFAARRLGREGVVLLAAVREGEADAAPGAPPGAAAGVPSLRLEGLDDGSAAQLVGTRGDVAPGVAGRLVEASGGNPLALLEVPTLLSPEQRAGREPLPSPLPPGAGTERALGRRVAALPEETRRALVVAAALQGDGVDVLFEALGAAGLPAAALDAAEREGVVALGPGGLEFRHPLLRALVYHQALAAERRAAHAALADASRDARRRAWHLAASAVAPDEAIAAELDAVARDARERGGSVEAGHAFARAAELSVDGDARARRDLEAAHDCLVAGQFERGLALVEDGARTATDPHLISALRRVRGHIELRRGAPGVAHAVLTDEAERLEPTAPAEAAATFVDASLAHMMTGDMPALMAGAERARRLAEGGVAPAVELLATVIVGETLLAQGRTAEGDALLDATVPVLLTGDLLAAGLPEVVGMAGHASIWVERWDRAEAVLGALVGAARRASAFGLLVYPLAAHAILRFRRGDWTGSLADAAESVQLARETSQFGLLAHCLAVLAHVEAGLGRTREAQEHGQEGLELCRMLGATATSVYALHALGFDDLSQGRLEDALGPLGEAQSVNEHVPMDEPGIVQWRPDHVEALARLGRTEEAREALAAVTRLAEATQRRWALAAVARCRGLLAPADAFEADFATALAHHEHDGQPFEKARTQLALGERLRRARRHADAREPLQAALDAFERLGARPWAARALDELRAAGAPAAPRGGSDSVSETLTPQELRIALLVAQGMTNREVAAVVFLSPKTIEHHLGQIYRRLGVRSRAQLTRLLVGEGAVASAA